MYLGIIGLSPRQLSRYWQADEQTRDRRGQILSVQTGQYSICHEGVITVSCFK
jgi:hypothetical protein